MKASIYKKFIIAILFYPISISTSGLYQVYKSPPLTTERSFGNLVLKPDNFDLRVFSNGRVQGNFEISNKSTYFRNKFCLEFIFFSTKDKDERSPLHKERTKEFRLVEEGYDTRRFDLNIKEELAQQVKDYEVEVHGVAYHSNSAINYIVKNKKNLIFCTVSLILFLIIFIYIYYPGKRKR